MKALKSHK